MSAAALVSEDVLVRLLPSSLEWLTLVLLAGAFFPRVRGRWVHGLSVAALLALNWLSLPLLQDRTALQYLFVISLLVLWGLLVLRVNVFQGLFVALLGLTYLMAVDYVILSVAATRMPLRQMAADRALSCCVIYSTRLIELVAVAIIYIWSREYIRRRAPDTIGWITAILFLAPVFGLCAYLSRVLWMSQAVYDHFVITAAFVLLAELGAVCLLYFSGQKQEAVRSNAILRQDLKLEQEHIAALESSYARQRAQTHDFKNKLAVLRTMAEQDAPREEFASYLSSVLAEDIPGALCVNTHRTAADITLSQKVPRARDMGIEFQMQLDDLSAFPMPDDALVVVLTNLIDNAVEACRQIPPEGRRYIMLKMKMTSRYGILNIENTTAGPVPVRYNTVPTTKKDRLSHGYGLKNVAAMIGRSDGMYFIEYREDDGVFRFCASVPRTAAAV